MAAANEHLHGTDGFSADDLVVPPGKSSVNYLVRLPENLTILRPSRVFVLGTSIIRGKDGRLHGLLAVSPKQIVITSTAPLLSLSLDRDSAEVVPGSTVRLNATLQRNLDFPDEAEIILDLPDKAKGFSLTPCRIARGQTKAELRVKVSTRPRNSAGMAEYDSALTRHATATRSILTQR